MVCVEVQCLLISSISEFAAKKALGCALYKLPNASQPHRLERRALQEFASEKWPRILAYRNKNLLFLNSEIGKVSLESECIEVV